ncbi:MAG TPA: peptidoglycan-binding protein [Polyangiaceae bacterium]|nr:peptidoglycan-binding protein [Polyangiaceae bacterium]
MIIKHIAEQGDCVASIAAQYGTTPDRILNLEDNKEFLQKRKDPNVLFRGDVVSVPRDPNTETVPTETSQTFRLSGRTTRLKICLRDCLNLPRKNVSYRLVIGDKEVVGKTDEKGNIDQPILAELKDATLFVDGGEEPFDVHIGAIDPVDELTGVQARLNNLGYDAGPEDGVLGPQTEAAVRAFQFAQGFEESGKPDSATQKALLKVHEQ